MSRAEPSALPSLSTGKPSLVQTTAASAPGRVWATFLTFSSIDTIARPFLSWPVTTRRIVRLIGCPPASAVDARPNIISGRDGVRATFNLGRSGRHQPCKKDGNEKKRGHTSHQRPPLGRTAEGLTAHVPPVTHARQAGNQMMLL